MWFAHRSNSVVKGSNYQKQTRYHLISSFSFLSFLLIFFFGRKGVGGCIHFYIHNNNSNNNYYVLTIKIIEHKPKEKQNIWYRKGSTINTSDYMRQELIDALEISFFSPLAPTVLIAWNPHPTFSKQHHPTHTERP